MMSFSNTVGPSLKTIYVHRDCDDGRKTSREGIKQAMFQLLSHNTTSQELLREAANEQMADMSERSDVATPNLTVDVLLKTLEEDAVAMGTPLAMAAAVTLANHIQALVSGSQNDLLLTEQQRRELNVIISAAVSLQTRGDFNKNAFVRLLNRETMLPTEVVWRLHSVRIMLLDIFITCNISKPSVIGSLSNNVVRLCESGEQSSRAIRKEIVQDMTSYLVGQAYGDQISQTGGATAKGLKKVSAALLDNITKKILAQYLERKVFDVHLHAAVMSAPSLVDNAALKKYSNRQLCIILGHNPVIKVSGALQNQQEWSYAWSDHFIKEMFAQLLTKFTAGEAVALLKQVLEQHDEVNWQMLLSYSSSVLVCYQEAPPALSDLVQDLVLRALEACEADGLIAGFLLARQAANEGPHVFLPYQQWFGNTFGDGSSSLAANKKMFTFLMKFLTDIVPFEAPSHLRAHVLRPPAVPPKCRPLLSDYITLAKTRLMDLKEPLEELGIYGADSAKNEKVQEQASQDVDKALQSFEKTGKVPANIMEASIFRKPYFIGHFLSALLFPRPLPDLPDLRMKLIEALQKSEKIPPAMYATYRASCDKMAAQLMQGVFSDDEDDMEDLLLSPWKQVQNSMTSLQEAILSSHKSGEQDSLSSHISVLSDKIMNYLPVAPPGERPAHRRDGRQDPLDLDLLVIQKEHSQILSELFALMANVESASSDVRLAGPDSGLIGPETGLTGPETDLTGPEADLNGPDVRPVPVWRLQLLTMVTKHPALWQDFCAQLLNKLTKKCTSASVAQTRSLAAVLVHLFTYPDVLPTPLIRHNGLVLPYLPHICKVLVPSCRHNMIFLLQLLYFYLDCGLRQFQGVRLHYAAPKQAMLPGDFITMFAYLSQRLIPSVDQPTCSSPSHQGELCDQWPGCISDVTDMYNRREVTSLLKGNQLTLKDWVALELGVCPGNDLLRSYDRQRYLVTRLLHHYLPRPVSEGGSNHDVLACLSAVCTGVLNADQSGTSACRVVGECGCRSGGSNSRTDLILLAQRLVTMVEMQSVTVTTSPWLPHFICQRLAAVSKHHSNQIHNHGNQIYDHDNVPNTFGEVINAFSLVEQLPAHLLVCNSLHHYHKQSLEGATDLVTLINQYWRHHLTTGVVLSLEITAHIVQGVLSLWPDNDDLAAHILQQCPALLPAVLYHWASLSHLRQIITGDLTGAFSLIMRHPAQLYCLIDRLCSRDLNIRDVSGKLGGYHGNMWLLGVALYSRLINRNGNFDGTQQQLIEWIDSGFELTNQNPLIACVTCLLAGLAWQSLYEEELDTQICELLQCLWRREPNVLVQCVATGLSDPGHGTNITSDPGRGTNISSDPGHGTNIDSDPGRSTNITSDHGCGTNKSNSGSNTASAMYSVLPAVSTKLIAIVLSRLLVTMTTDDVINMLSVEGITRSVLLVYTRCVQQYDTRPADDCTDQTQQVKVPDLMKLSSLVQTILRHATRDHVSTLPMELVCSCDTEIRTAVAAAMKR